MNQLLSMKKNEDSIDKANGKKVRPSVELAVKVYKSEKKYNAHSNVM